MKYQIENGGVVEATTPLELINKLKQGGRFTEGQTPEEYVLGFSQRAKQDKNVNIRTDSFENFVEDIIKYDYVTPINS